MEPTLCCLTAKARRCEVAQHDSFDAVFYTRRVEIYKKTKLQSMLFHIGNQLSLVNRNQPLNGFKLKNNAIFNQKVDFIVGSSFLFL
jgi:hypothetical protein